jgi:hypothetical protein
MSTALRTESALADLLDVTPEKAAELRRRHKWAHVRLGRFDVRYTDTQVEQVIASMTVTPKRAEKPSASGLSSRSRRAS